MFIPFKKMILLSTLTLASVLQAQEVPTLLFGGLTNFNAPALSSTTLASGRVELVVHSSVLHMPDNDTDFSPPPEMADIFLALGLSEGNALVLDFAPTDCRVNPTDSRIFECEQKDITLSAAKTNYYGEVEERGLVSIKSEASAVRLQHVRQTDANDFTQEHFTLVFRLRLKLPGRFLMDLVLDKNKIFPTQH